MRIVVFADTHRDFFALNNAIKRNLDVDIFLHLGDGEKELKDVQALYPDKTFHFVCGNRDYGSSSPASKVIEVAGVKIYMTHGHESRVHDGLDTLVQNAKLNGARIALYGHTHIYNTAYIDDVHVMNPGSLYSPRGRRLPSYGVIDITDAGIVLNIVTIEK